MAKKQTIQPPATIVTNTIERTELPEDVQYTLRVNPDYANEIYITNDGSWRWNLHGLTDAQKRKYVKKQIV